MSDEAGDAPRRDPDPPAATPGRQAGLLRALGPGAAIAVVVGNTIGSGIFLKPGRIAEDGGDFALIITAWVTGGLLSILGALSFAELATMLPRAGGLFVYLREAYGRPVAFLFGWNEFLFVLPGSIAALAMAFIGSLATAAGWPRGMAAQVACAIGLIAGMAWVNFMGVIWGGRVQVATTLIKAAGVGLAALAPFVFHLWTGAGIDGANYRSALATSGAALGAPAPAEKPAPPAESAPWATRLGLILLAVMWAYNGWHGVTPVAEEIRDPARNIPRALFGGVGIVILLYLAANVAYHGVLSMAEMAAAGDHAAEEMARRLLGGAGVTAISGIIMVSTFGAINSNMLLGPRVSFAMGRDDVFFRQLGRVHASYRTPATAIAVQAVMAAALVVVSAVLKRLMAGVDAAAVPSATLGKAVLTLQRDSIFTLLTNFVIFAASIFYMLGVMAVFLLRKKRPDWPRTYRTWGYPVVPALFLLAYAWFLWRVYLDKPFEAHAGLVLIGLGLPVYFAWQAWAARRPAARFASQERGRAV